MNDRIRNRINELNERLKKEYEFKETNDETIFVKKNGKTFVLSGHEWGDFGNYGDCIIVENGESVEYPRTAYWDTEIYCLDEMNEREMFEKIVHYCEKC